MSSEQLADGVNPLDAELAATWDILKGYSGRDTDLGIARRFGGAAAAYSLRDIGAMNGRVVKVRRDVDGQGSDPEEDFSANQVQNGALEDWVNGKLESTLPADVATAAAAYSLRKVKADYSGEAVRIRRSSDDVEVDVAFDSDDKVSASSAITNVAEQGGESGSTTATDLNGFLNETLTVGTAVNGTGSFNNYTFTANGNTGFDADNSAGGIGSAGFPYSFASADVMTVRYTVTNFSSTSGLSPQIRGTTGTNSVNSVASGGTTFTANGTYTDTLTATADGTHLMFADGNTGSYTISDFQILSHTHQAFVHTWYDQAGSNDAVQATAANQPKIAESGALLTDGIDFDGSNDRLDITNSLPITGANARSVFTIVNKDVSSSSDNILGIGDNGSGVNSQLWNLATTYGLYYNGGNTVFGAGALNTNQLVTAIYPSSASDSGDTVLFINSVSSSITSNVDTTLATDNTVARIGSGGGSAGGNLDGSLQELIIYASDQSDNRFKIESNINNYYGLYNDANDLTQTEWQNTGAESFSSTSTDGFSYSNSSSTSFVGVTLKETLALNDSVFVSFNASGVTHPDSSDQSPQIRLRDAVDGGSGSSPINQVTNGFNSYTLTYNDGTKSNGNHIVFSEGDTAGGTVTITDFKVSRIARNGFVETWYDQSGNGEDMTQGTAGKQPSIVKNGGQVKDYNGNNSIDFVSGSTRVLDKSGTTTAKTCIVVLDEDSSGSAARAILGFSDNTSFMRLDTVDDLEVKAGGVSANYRAVPTDVTSLYFWYTNGTDEDKLFANNVEEGDTTSNTPPNLPFTRIGARNSDSDPYNSRITEVIAFAEDLSADRTEIQDDINNNYNIF